ncbi:MAG: hypothetical protein ACR2LR_18910 [Hassallia sp.]
MQYLSNPYRVGEVCQIIVKDNPDLRGKGEYWCIVNYLGDYICGGVILIEFRECDRLNYERHKTTSRSQILN